MEKNVRHEEINKILKQMAHTRGLDVVVEHYYATDLIRAIFFEHSTTSRFKYIVLFLDELEYGWSKTVEDIIDESFTTSSIEEYCKNDSRATHELYKWALNSIYGIPKATYVSHRVPKIKNVIFNDPATIIFWEDGTKTVVKAQDEEFDSEKGIAMAIAKKALGNNGKYFNEIKKWLPKENENGNC